MGVEAPEKCAKCKKRGWHTGRASEVNTPPNLVRTAALKEIDAEETGLHSILSEIGCTATAPAKVSDALRQIQDHVVALAKKTIDEVWPSCSECAHSMTGKIIKGRGMVYACTDVSCPLYGLERR